MPILRGATFIIEDAISVAVDSFKYTPENSHDNRKPNIWTCISYQKNVTFLKKSMVSQPLICGRRMVVEPLQTSNLWVSGHNLQIGSEPSAKTNMAWLTVVDFWSKPKGSLQTQVKLYMELTFLKILGFWKYLEILF